MRGDLITKYENTTRLSVVKVHSLGGGWVGKKERACMNAL